MDIKRTALLLVGLQNDYFTQDGKLHKYVEGSSHTLKNIISLVDALASTDMLIIFAPIIFRLDSFIRKGTEDYLVGILNMVKNSSAFKEGSTGVEMVKELHRYKDRLITLDGIYRPNVFHNTKLEDILEENNITNVVLSGALSSICIDGTGRSAYEKNYFVVQLSDCTSSRSVVEQEFFCKSIFPLYSKVMTSNELLESLTP